MFIFFKNNKNWCRCKSIINGSFANCSRTERLHLHVDSRVHNNPMKCQLSPIGCPIEDIFLSRVVAPSWHFSVVPISEELRKINLQWSFFASVIKIYHFSFEEENYTLNKKDTISISTLLYSTLLPFTFNVIVNWIHFKRQSFIKTETEMEIQHMKIACFLSKHKERIRTEVSFLVAFAPKFNRSPSWVRFQYLDQVWVVKTDQMLLIIDHI